MRSLVLALASAALLSSPLAVQAQAPSPGTVQFIGNPFPNGDIDGNPVGPYVAALDGFVPNEVNSAYSFVWCVDALHDVNYAPDRYFATAFAGNTYAGNGDFSRTRGVTDLGLSSAAAATRYKQAAWIVEQNMLGKSEFSAVRDVQGTLWRMMGASLSDTFNDLRGTTAFTSISNWSSVVLRYNWYVLSDDRTECKVGGVRVCPSPEDVNQEYLMFRDARVVPEPSTYLLMVGGLAGLAVVARRRRRLA